MAAEFPLRTKITAVETASPVFRRVSQQAKIVGKRLQSVGRAWSTSVTAPVTALGFSVGRSVFKFQTQMNLVKGLTGETGVGLQKLTDQAKLMGSESAFSASEAAAGQAFLAQAGFKTEQILSALPATLNLAAAGGIELAEAADIASNVLTGFGLRAEKTGRLTDVMAFTTSSANTNILQLGQAMKFVAPVARGAGVSLEETSAIIGSLGDAGLQADMAGTALRGSIIGLLKPSNEAVKTLKSLGFAKSDIVNDEGKLVSFTGVIEKLAAAGATTEDIFSIFGQRPGTAIQALVGRLQAEGNNALRLRVGRTMDDSDGSAKKLADTRMEGLPGALKRVQSAWEAMNLAAGESGFTAGLVASAESARRFLIWVKNLSPETLKVVSSLAFWAAATGPVIFGLGSMVRLIGFSSVGLVSLRTGLVRVSVASLAFGRGAAVSALIGLASLRQAAASFALVLTRQVLPAVARVGLALLANPVGLAIAGVAALIAAGVALYKNWDKVAAFFGGIWKRIKSSFTDGIGWIKRQLDDSLVGKALGFVGIELGSSKSAAPVDTSEVARAVAPGRGQDGRAAVDIMVRSGREDVRARATDVSDVDLKLEQGLSLGVIG